jgi:uncharacterized UBP type Zn finger protein
MRSRRRAGTVALVQTEDDQADAGHLSVCAHLGQIQLREPPDAVDGCEDCLRTGGKWLHLRICLTCGKVGCCDSSPNRHASAHYRLARHPIIRSLEPGEGWSWCYIDEVGFVVPELTGETLIPPSPLGG